MDGIIITYEMILGEWIGNDSTLPNEHLLFTNIDKMMELYKQSQEKGNVEFSKYLEVAMSVFWLKRVWLNN